MRLSILLFDGFTALDVVGGYEVLCRLPGMEVEFVARECGAVAADSGALGMIATRTFDQLQSCDILYVPGGPGVAAAMGDPALLACIQRGMADSGWVFAVCNGVQLLGAAGVLPGRTVTTNWFARAAVSAWGATVLQQRVVRDGRLVTGAGVSSSIDAALFLAAQISDETVARTIQLGIEYYPEPPFGSGTPDTAPAALQDIVARVERNAGRLLASRKIAFAAIPGAKTTAATPDRQTRPH